MSSFTQRGSLNAVSRIIQQNNTTELMSTMTRLTAELQLYESKIPIIHLFKKRIDGDPYDYIPKNEIDEYFRTQAAKFGPPELSKNLYKLTSRPTASDFSSFTLCAKIYGLVDNLFAEINDEDSIPVTEKVFKYCMYFRKKPDISSISGIDVDYC